MVRKATSGVRDWLLEAAGAENCSTGGSVGVGWCDPLVGLDGVSCGGGVGSIVLLKLPGKSITETRLTGSATC